MKYRGFTAIERKSCGSVALGNGGGSAIPDNDWAVHLNNFSSNNTIVGNVISGNTGHGVFVNGGSGNIIQGNLIGTDEMGMAALGNSLGGVVIITGANNTVGGTNPGEGNIIAANAAGVTLSGGGIASSGNLVQGNSIGTDASGMLNLGNSGDGVRISFGFNNSIGGASPGAANTIAFNGAAGVFVNFNSTDNPILSNVIFANAGLGIELFPAGVTPNDGGDGDTGANTLQNFPVLSVSTDISGTTLVGSLDSAPNTTFSLELFSSTVCDPSGFGQGESLLGTAMMTTNGSGEANFTLLFPSVVPNGHFVTATATDPNGNTSEFSECSLNISDTDGDGVPDSQDLCPNSDLNPTVVIDGCDSGVANQLDADGCTLADLIQEIAAGAANHGQFVSGVAQLANDLKKAGIITGQEKGALQSCAAQANLP